MGAEDFMVYMNKPELSQHVLYVSNFSIHGKYDVHIQLCTQYHKCGCDAKVTLFAFLFMQAF